MSCKYDYLNNVIHILNNISYVLNNVMMCVKLFVKSNILQQITMNINNKYDIWDKENELHCCVKNPATNFSFFVKFTQKLVNIGI